MSSRLTIGLIIALWNLPWVLHIAGISPSRPLNGYQGEATPGKPTMETIQSGEFQSKTEDFLRVNFPFRPDAIRMQHQIDWSLFGKQHVKSTVVGKEGFLFERAYVNAARGLDPLDPEEIQRRSKAIKQASDSTETPIVVALAPGKGHFFREFLPPCLEAKCGDEPNRGHRLWKSALQSVGIPVLDLHSAFDTLRIGSKHPLFPKTGIHWSEFSMTQVVPALCQAVDAVLPVPLASGSWHVDSVRTTKKPEGTDDDIERAMNLLFDLPDFQMAYPVAQWEPSPARPKVLLVGDSYAWTPVNRGILRDGWQGEFWFYNQTAHGPDVQTKGMKVEARLSATGPDFLANQDAILLLSTDANLSRFPFGFAGIGSNLPMTAQGNASSGAAPQGTRPH